MKYTASFAEYKGKGWTHFLMWLKSKTVYKNGSQNNTYALISIHELYGKFSRMLRLFGNNIYPKGVRRNVTHATSKIFDILNSNIYARMLLYHLAASPIFIHTL